ncbi:hypothetical protein AHF37_03051 [Paragonimus kellicotti]|nr:hypothetical protein AHF37_03051 [Paragonimus kellicotti]
MLRTNSNESTSESLEDLFEKPYGDQCVLWIRKLLTELFETFAACIEGSLNLTAYLEYLITDSKGQLDNLCEQVNAVGHYLLPIFTEDFEQKNSSYLAKMIGQLGRLRTTTEQTNESLRTVWTVERIALIEAIGLSTNHLETIEQENDIFRPDPVTNAESSGSRRLRGGALSSTLRLQCSTRNVAQPLFYQQLLSNPNEHVSLFDIKLLLKSASDEFVQLSKVFCDVFRNQNNLTEETSLFPKISDICQELSTLLTEQETCLLHLFELCDTGLPTLLCIVKQFVSECLQPVDSGEQTPRGLDWFKSKLDTWQNILPLNRFQGSVVSGSNSDVANTRLHWSHNKALVGENTRTPSGLADDRTTTLLMKLTRLFKLSKSSKSQNVIEDVERILQAFKSATEKCTNDWESLYTELVSVTCAQSDDVITEQNNQSATWWSEPAESLDVDEVRAQNQQNYICVNSIDYIREQKEAISERLVNAHRHHQDCVDAIEKQQEVNKRLQAQFEQYEQEFRKTMAASLADLDHEVDGGLPKST